MLRCAPNVFSPGPDRAGRRPRKIGRRGWRVRTDSRCDLFDSSRGECGPCAGKSLISEKGVVLIKSAGAGLAGLSAPGLKHGRPVERCGVSYGTPSRSCLDGYLESGKGPCATPEAVGTRAGTCMKTKSVTITGPLYIAPRYSTRSLRGTVHVWQKRRPRQPRNRAFLRFDPRDADDPSDADRLAGKRLENDPESKLTKTQARIEKLQSEAPATVKTGS